MLSPGALTALQATPQYAPPLVALIAYFAWMTRQRRVLPTDRALYRDFLQSVPLPYLICASSLLLISSRVGQYMTWREFRIIEIFNWPLELMLNPLFVFLFSPQTILLTSIVVPELLRDPQNVDRNTRRGIFITTALAMLVLIGLHTPVFEMVNRSDL